MLLLHLANTFYFHKMFGGCAPSRRSVNRPTSDPASLESYVLPNGNDSPGDDPGCWGDQLSSSPLCVSAPGKGSPESSPYIEEERRASHSSALVRRDFFHFMEAIEIYLDRGQSLIVSLWMVTGLIAQADTRTRAHLRRVGLMLQ